MLLADPAGDPGDRLLEPGPGLGVGGPGGPLEDRLSGDDVGGQAGPKAPDGDHDRIQGTHVPTGDALQGADNLGAHLQRIDTHMGHGPVSAFTDYFKVVAIHGGQEGA